MLAHVQCYFQGQTLISSFFWPDWSQAKRKLNEQTDYLNQLIRKTEVRLQLWDKSEASEGIGSFTFIALDQSWTKDDSPHMIWKSKQFTTLIGGYRRFK